MIVLATAIAFQLSAGIPTTRTAPLGVTALVARARAARVQQDSMLASYRAVARQRMSSSIGLGSGLGLAPIGRDRLAARFESVARIGWDHRLGAWAEIVAARSVVPMLGMLKPQAEADDAALTLPYYPGRDRLWPMSEVRDALNGHDDWIAHPLYAGGDSVYDFSLGDSLQIRPSEGRTIRLREIRVRPRRPAPRLIVGSLWVDVESGSLVRAAYRPSVAMDLWPFFEREIGRDDREKVKRLGPFTGVVREVIVDHALYEGQFWLPRTRIVNGEATAKGGRISISIAQSFQYEEVTAVAPGAKAVVDADAPDIDPLTGRVRSPTWHGVEQRTRRCRETGDSTNARWSPDSLFRDDRLSIMNAEGVRFRVLIPCDAQSLVDSPLLPGSIYSAGEALFKNTDLSALHKEVEASLGLSRQSEWNPQPPSIFYGIDRDLLRFNRVEGLSAGVMIEGELGNGYVGMGSIRFGLADREPNAELTLRRTNGATGVEASVYRRLVASNDWGRPLGPGASLSALLFGRDDGFYYRTLGAEFAGNRGSASDAFALAWRLFGERQFTAAVETQRSFANMTSGVRFQPNIVSRDGVYVGGATTARYALGVDPQATRLSGSTRIEAAAGEAEFARGMTELTLSRGVGANAQIALTGAAGVSAGALPTQRNWFLGGPQTVHGHIAGAMQGDAFWLGRVELTKGNPLVRPVLFGDLGWAGPRAEWTTSRTPLSGAGAGLALLDGAVRFDVARALDAATRRRWRVDLYIELR